MNQTNIQTRKAQPEESFANQSMMNFSHLVLSRQNS